MITKEKVNTWLTRKKIELHTQYDENPNKFDNRYKKEKIYDFYICDYCRMRIKIMPNLKRSEQEGGKVTIPSSLINNESVEIVAHNRCIKNLVRELEELKIQER